jgi:hypothetical protein
MKIRFFPDVYECMILPRLKGPLTRDFRPLVFFIKQLLLGPLIQGLKSFRIQLRIHEDIRQSWFHSGVNYTAVQSVHVTAVSMIPLYVHFTPLSMTPLCNKLCRISLRMILNTVFMRKPEYLYKKNIHWQIVLQKWGLPTDRFWSQRCH